MATDLKLPLLGDVMTEGTLAAWLCDDGVEVAAGQPLYRLETDKVTMDIEAPAAGILRQLVPAGTDVPVGQLIGRLLVPGEPDDPSPVASPASSSPSSPPPTPATSQQSSSPEGEIRATPAARRLARDLGVDLAAVAARTGGMVREDDVRAYAEER
ncbi:MAG TPA: biotin/lipoyl-containing protein [Chloroflexota bacterium]|nr:biotin/lipoyl-containing protein [Chloroflexota bacterium]